MNDKQQVVQGEGAMHKNHRKGVGKNIESGKMDRLLGYSADGVSFVRVSVVICILRSNRQAELPDSSPWI